MVKYQVTLAIFDSVPAPCEGDDPMCGVTNIDIDSLAEDITQRALDKALEFSNFTGKYYHVWDIVKRF